MLSETMSKTKFETLSEEEKILCAFERLFMCCEVSLLDGFEKDGYITKLYPAEVKAMRDWLAIKLVKEV